MRIVVCYERVETHCCCQIIELPDVPEVLRAIDGNGSGDVDFDELPDELKGAIQEIGDNTNNWECDEHYVNILQALLADAEDTTDFVIETDPDGGIIYGERSDESEVSE